MLEIILKQFRAILKQELKQSVLEINRELRTGEAFIRTDLALLKQELKAKPVSFLNQPARNSPKSCQNR